MATELLPKENPTILARKPGRKAPCYHPNNIVLAKVDGYQPYVTWIEVCPVDRPAFFVSGHYYAELDDAMDDFRERT